MTAISELDVIVKKEGRWESYEKGNKSECLLWSFKKPKKGINNVKESK